MGLNTGVGVGCAIAAVSLPYFGEGKREIKYTNISTTIIRKPRIIFLDVCIFVVMSLLVIFYHSSVSAVIGLLYILSPGKTKQLASGELFGAFPATKFLHHF